MNEIQMARMPAAVIIAPDDWRRIQVHCTETDQSIGRFLAEAALRELQRQKKGGKK